MAENTFHGTTIVSVRRGSHVALGGDGQVTLGNVVVKAGARKVRRVYQDRILAGFAGSAADSFALFSRFESKLEQYRGNLERAAVERTVEDVGGKHAQREGDEQREVRSIDHGSWRESRNNGIN